MQKVKYLFGNFPKVYLFTLKFNLLDHVIEAVKHFGSRKYLDITSFENFSFVIKKLILMTCMRNTSCLSEAINGANKAFTTDYSIVGRKAGNRAFWLARDGISTKLECIYDSVFQKLTHLESGRKNNLALTSWR